MKILVTPRSFGKANPELFERLRAAGLDVTRNDSGGILSREAMQEKLADCAGVILGIDPLDAGVLAAAPQLRAVAKYGVGLDNIDLEVCKARGIRVSRTVGANSEAVADYAFALMLAVARKLVPIHTRCCARDWGKITSIDIYGKTLGIVGLGAIGRCVARRAQGFGMRVLAHDVIWDADYAARVGIRRVDLDTLCREADVISLHAALTPDNRQCINAARIALMRENAILINTARGELVDEAALLAALKQGRIYGAGLDVFMQEPPAASDWYELDNVVMGSHCSSSTAGATACMGHMAVDNLLRDLGLAD